MLASGRSVVLDASFRAPSFRRRALELAERHGVLFSFVECQASAEVCKARLARRLDGTTASDAKVDIFDAFRTRYQPAGELPAEMLIRIETERPIESCSAELRLQLL